jgi:hypothetical protein
LQVAERHRDDRLAGVREERADIGPIGSLGM